MGFFWKKEIDIKASSYWSRQWHVGLKMPHCLAQHTQCSAMTAVDDKGP